MTDHVQPSIKWQLFDTQTRVQILQWHFSQSVFDSVSRDIIFHFVLCCQMTFHIFGDDVAWEIENLIFFSQRSAFMIEIGSGFHSHTKSCGDYEWNVNSFNVSSSATTREVGRWAMNASGCCGAAVIRSDEGELPLLEKIRRHFTTCDEHRSASKWDESTCDDDEASFCVLSLEIELFSASAMSNFIPTGAQLDFHPLSADSRFFISKSVWIP